MNLNPSDRDYHEHWLDLPFSSPENPPSREAAMTTPGCCLKSIERESPVGFPKYLGRLVHYREIVVVISYPGEDKFIWTGNAKEFFDFWDCD